MTPAAMPSAERCRPQAATRRLAAGSRFGRSTIEEIVAAGGGEGQDRALFNQAAQAYNHEFYWNSMAPGGGGEPEGPLRQALETGFGDLKGFRQAFREAAARRRAERKRDHDTGADPG